jgi:hypothetical protein
MDPLGRRAARSGLAGVARFPAGLEWLGAIRTLQRPSLPNDPTPALSSAISASSICVITPNPGKYVPAEPGFSNTCEFVVVRNNAALKTAGFISAHSPTPSGGVHRGLRAISLKCMGWAVSLPTRLPPGSGTIGQSTSAANQARCAMLSRTPSSRRLDFDDSACSRRERE